jgi:hypothetical protein
MRFPVIPAKAGIYFPTSKVRWIPTFVGKTTSEVPSFLN